MKIVLRVKFITLSTSRKKLESSHTSNVKVCLEAPAAEEASTKRGTQGRKMIKIGTEINQLETKKVKQRIFIRGILNS